MLSPNLALRKAYFATLRTIEYKSNPVPVFFGQLPTTVAPGVYIIFSQIRNNDNSNKTAAITQTSVTVSIYTNSLKYNDGVAVEVIANEVMNRIYSTTHFALEIDPFFQVIGTQLTSDITNDFSQDQQNIYIDRILIFNHTIFQNPS